MSWAQADYFRVPLLDGQFGIGQVFERDHTPNGSAFCGLTILKTDAAAQISPIIPIQIAAFVFLDPAHLTDGTWALAGFDQIPKYDFFFDFPAQQQAGFPDVTVHDPAVIEAFLNAWHGLYPWDAFGDLFDQIKRPDMDPDIV